MAQTKRGDKFEPPTKQIAAFISNKVDNPFPNIDTLKAYTSAPFYFKDIDKPSIIYFGADGCAPCRLALPIVAKISNDPKYKNYNFIYVTYDDSATIRKEFTSTSHIDMSNMTILLTSLAEINDDRMVYAYPTVYYLDAHKVVKIVTVGGKMGDLEKVEADIRAKLDSVAH